MDTKIKNLENYKIAYFAGGCFWCTESDLRKAVGVIEVISGYSGGHVDNPTYSDVTSETSGHREAVKVYYDDSVTNFEELTHYHLMHIDPTDGGGQFYDRGESYEPVIFYTSEDEKVVAEKAVRELDESKLFEKPIAVKVIEFKNFYTAEEYYQKYAENNNANYCVYRDASGRDMFLAKYFGGKTWGDITNKDK